MTEKKIILIAYNYPPAHGVGARRWAKISKFLAQRGYTVHVITADHQEKFTHSPWLKDTQAPLIHIHKVKGGINPNWLLGTKAPKIFKLKERICYKFARRFLHWIDYAEGWGKAMTAKLDELVKKEGIRNIVVTTPPNSVGYFAALYKMSNPQLNLIQDVRDSWNEDPYDFGYPKPLGSVDYKNKSIFMQEVAFRFCDKLVAVTHTLVSIFSKNWLVGDKAVCLTNGFDPEEAEPISVEKSKKLRFVYLGNASGTGRAQAVDLLQSAVTDLSKTDPFWEKSCEFVFVGDSRLQLSHPSFIKLPYMNSRDLAREVKISHLGFSINNPEYYYAYGSKVFDYMLHQLPMFLISEPGELFDLIESRKIGYTSDYNLEKLKSKLTEVKNDFLANKLPLVDSKIVEEFSFSTITGKFVQLFEKSLDENRNI